MHDFSPDGPNQAVGVWAEEVTNLRIRSKVGQNQRTPGPPPLPQWQQVTHVRMKITVKMNLRDNHCPLVPSAALGLNIIDTMLMHFPFQKSSRS